LTGLSNRQLFNDRLASALADQHGGAVDVLLLDLDDFKEVNDILGHHAGDQMLIEVGRRLRACVRPSDIVARLGGDEFVVMSSGLAMPAQADALAHKLLDAIRAPFQIGSVTCRVSLTIGYALAPLDGTDAVALLKRADAAMYDGKQAGKGVARRAA
jgi:diguanylate cyclase (GGDEF)-like protein